MEIYNKIRTIPNLKVRIFYYMRLGNFTLYSPFSLRYLNSKNYVEKNLKYALYTTLLINQCKNIRK